MAEGASVRSIEPELETFIRTRMVVAAVPGVPEIRLNLAGPSSQLGRFLMDEAPVPYWAFVWGGGLALARFVLDQKSVVAGQRVLDLGAGSGLVSIAARKAGALAVRAVDVDPRACLAIRLNAEQNGVDVDIEAGDPLDGPVPGSIDVVLVGDLFYEASLARRVMSFLERCRAAGLKVLVGDPGRSSLPVPKLARVGAASARDFGGSPPGLRPGEDRSAGGVFSLR